MTQSWAFGDAKRAMNWQPRRLLFRQEETPVAICQVLRRTVACLPVLNRINHGPMLLAGHADKALEVLCAIRQHWQYFSRGILFIAPNLPYCPETLNRVVELGFHPRGSFRWASSRMDLTLSEHDLRGSLTHKWRNRLRNSERYGLRFTVSHAPADVEWIVQRHVEHMAAKGYDGPAPELIRALYRAAPDDFVVFAVEGRGSALAGLAAYRFGDVAHAYITWNGPEGRKLNAGNFLFWNAALELKRCGCTQFDLGGHNNTVGFGAFKCGMNGTGYELLGEFVCA